MKRYSSILDEAEVFTATGEKYKPEEKKEKSKAKPEPKVEPKKAAEKPTMLKPEDEERQKYATRFARQVRKYMAPPYDKLGKHLILGLELIDHIKSVKNQVKGDEDKYGAYKDAVN